MSMLSSSRGTQMTLAQKFLQLNWGLMFLLLLVSSVGFAMLYSAAGGDFEPWALRQMVRFAVGGCLMILVAMVDLRIWMRYAYLIYGVGLLMLIWVDVAGVVGMGRAALDQSRPAQPAALGNHESRHRLGVGALFPRPEP